MRIDLQVHTSASDGTLTPAEVVSLARGERIDVIGLTDHDTLDGVGEAVAAAGGSAPRIVPGVELTAGRVHVLGLFVSDTMRTALERLRREREDRAREMVRRLVSLGFEITFEDVLAQSHRGVVARPHVARALVSAGYVPDVASAFTPQLIGDGGAADVPRAPMSAEDAIALVRSAGGVAVLAHPGALRTSVDDDRAAELTRAGLSGIEVDHPDHPPAVRDRLRALADALGLVATGGSDFHEPSSRRLGACTTRPEAFARLESLAGRY